MKAFTILEFLVASFLALLLLTIIYQSFGQMASYYRLRLGIKQEKRALEAALFRWQWRHLRGKPLVLENGRYLALPTESQLGPLWAIYDLQKLRYGEVKGGYLSKKDLEKIPWFKGGIESLEVYILGETSKLVTPLEKWPSKGPLLIRARLSSGRKIRVMVP